jgi:hypothetical protein
MTDDRTIYREDEAVAHSGGGISTADIARGAGAGMARAQEDENQNAPLFTETDANIFRTRWRDIQGAFVDDPRTAVKEADGLVAETMKRMADMFSGERNRLEHEWDQGDNVSTEDLRQVLRRYRSFFNRLMSV